MGSNDTVVNRLFLLIKITGIVDSIKKLGALFSNCFDDRRSMRRDTNVLEKMPELVVVFDTVYTVAVNIRSFEFQIKSKLRM
jgi:hypothetical protein